MGEVGERETEKKDGEILLGSLRNCARAPSCEDNK